MMELESACSRGDPGTPGDSLQPQTPSRHEKSLGLLTTKFVTLLQEAKDGVLDLKAVGLCQLAHVTTLALAPASCRLLSMNYTL